MTSGSWVEGGLAVAGTGLESLGLAIDPLGTLAAYGVGWLMEHVQPLSDALDWLVGDPDAIASFAATWRNVGQSVSSAGEDFAAQVASDTAAWTGQAGDGYRAFAQGQIEQLSAAGRAAETGAAIVEGAGILVAVVREVVRDLVAECVATLIVRIPQWLAEEGATLGLATPHVVASAVTLISKWVARIGEVITKLIRSLNNLTPLIRQLDEIFSALRDGFRSADRVTGPPTPDGTSLPHTSPVAAPNTPDITTGPAAVVDTLSAVDGTEQLRAYLATEELHAPTLLDFEVVSTLRGLTLNGHLSPARATDLLTDFDDLPVQRWQFADGLRRRAFQLRDNLSPTTPHTSR